MTRGELELFLGAAAPKAKRLLRAAAGEGPWLVGVSSAQPRLLRLRGPGGELVWDIAADRPAPAGPKATPRAAPFSPDAFGPELEPVLTELQALCPASEHVTQWTAGGAALPGWALRFSQPAPWPLFLRLSVAAPFAGRAAELSRVLGRRRVVELFFGEKEQRAYVS